MIALSEFRRRWEARAEQLAAQGLRPADEPAESDGPIDEACVEVVVDGHGRRGRLCVWESGETDIEIADGEEQRVLWHRFRILDSDAQLDEVVDDLCAGMRTATPPAGG